MALVHKKLVFRASELDALRDHSLAVLTILNIATGPLSLKFLLLVPG